MADTFLTDKEIATLTGIGRGKGHRTKWQMQDGELTRLRIPHYVNQVGRPIVARAVIEGGRAPEKVATWSPGLVAQG